MLAALQTTQYLHWPAGGDTAGSTGSRIILQMFGVWDFFGWIGSLLLIGFQRPPQIKNVFDVLAGSDGPDGSCGWFLFIVSDLQLT